MYLYRYLVQVVPGTALFELYTKTQWKKEVEAATKKREKKKRRRSTTTAVHNNNNIINKKWKKQK